MVGCTGRCASPCSILVSCRGALDAGVHVGARQSPKLRNSGALRVVRTDPPPYRSTVGLFLERIGLEIPVSPQAARPAASETKIGPGAGFGA